jgi:hypothetical protein
MLPRLASGYQLVMKGITGMMQQILQLLLAGLAALASEGAMAQDCVVKPADAPLARTREEIAERAAHIAAVNRRRRIYVNNDVGLPVEFGLAVSDWVYLQFDLFDEPGIQVDTIAWCFDEGNLAAYPSKVIPVLQYAGLQKWLREGIDIIRVAVDETHKRRKEAFYVYRLNGVDWEDGKAWYLSPLKKKYPEWLVGYTWNFAVPEVRTHKLAILRELAENYDFDGIDIDFSRRPPHLPVGHQWENREALTDFMRQVRRMFKDVAHKRGRPLLLAARLPETIAGCHYDGIDIEMWTREDLLDIIGVGGRSIGVGGRSIDLDIAGYRRVIGDRNIKLMPSVDDFHATDGYRHQGIEFWRGLYGNWWHQGIDGAQTFNFFTQSKRAHLRFPQHPEADTPPGQQQAFREIGDPQTMRFKDALYVLQRRYGHEFGTDWGNFWYRNAQAPLPATLSADGVPSIQSLCVEDDVSANARRIAGIKLRVLLAGATPTDIIEAKFNGVLLNTQVVQEDNWRVFPLKPQHFAIGVNLVSIRLAKRAPEAKGSVSIEKVEVPVDYKH